jgi:hypothetical protein
MGILGLFFLFVDSTLAITSWHTITTSYYSTLHYSYFYFWFTQKKWIYNFALFNLLSLVVYLFMMMNNHLLIVSPLIITSGVVLKIASKTEETPIII